MKKYLFPLLILLLAALQLSAQRNDTAGARILFTNKKIQPDNYNRDKMLRDYRLTNKSNLFMTLVMEKPLTAYLQSLAPQLNDDTLSKSGNYQFSFYVDNRLIYQTNLLPGAPTLQQQKTETAWCRPLIDNQHEGALWSQSAWNRFMYNGGDDALTEGKHLLKIEVRPYVKTPDLKTGSIIASGQLALQVNRKPVVDLASIHLSAVKPYNGLEVSKETFDRDKIKALIAHINADAFKHVTSIVVIKNGKLLIEEYFNGANRDSLHDVRSVGKSFASTMTGIAIHDGYLTSENQTLKNFYDLKKYDHYSPAKNNTSIKSLLTMSSRFDGDDDNPQSLGNEENMYPAGDWVKFVLDLPVDTIKYTGQWHYFTGGAMLLGSMLNNIVPGGLEKYADTKLFKPLQIINYKWQYTPQHAPNTAGGIRMNALDFAKYGQLYKNNGSWGGAQLIPKTWVAKTFSRQKPITGRNGEYYGYLFWNKTYAIGDNNYEAWYCSGNGGNKIFIFKNVPVVVVITCTAYGQGYAHRQADRMVEEFILPAVVGE
jgi:CubicO group peptidase (beta-lactamase class C family)